MLARNIGHLNPGPVALRGNSRLLLVAPAPPARPALDHLKPARKATRQDVHIAVYFDVHSSAHTRSIACSAADRQEGIGEALTLLRAALLTLRYAQEHGAIGLTKTMAFKRVFVHWAVEHFDWPGKSAEEMFRYSKVINEYEFPPLEVLHQLLITLRLGRHFKGEFRLTKRGVEHASAPARLFAELIPFFVLQIDHSSYARFEDRPFGKWHVWMNVINVEADHGTTERALFAAFYGEDHDWDNAGWREMAAFSSCVLRPLEWAGLLVQNPEERDGKHIHHVFKTSLWRAAVELDTDAMLKRTSPR